MTQDKHAQAIIDKDQDLEVLGRLLEYIEAWPVKEDFQPQTWASLITGGFAVADNMLTHIQKVTAEGLAPAQPIQSLVALAWEWGVISGIEYHKKHGELKDGPREE